MLVSNLETAPGHRIVAHLGVAQGSTVRAKHVGRDFLAGLKNIVTHAPMQPFSKGVGEFRLGKLSPHHRPEVVLFFVQPVVKMGRLEVGDDFKIVGHRMGHGIPGCPINRQAGDGDDKEYDQEPLRNRTPVEAFGARLRLWPRAPRSARLLVAVMPTPRSARD